LIPNFYRNVKVALVNHWRYGKKSKYTWTIRSQAPKSVMSGYGEGSTTKCLWA